MGRDYFVSHSGNDDFDGLTVASAWKSVARATSHHFEDGDSLFFEGGHVFEGTLRITDLHADRIGFMMSSFGTERAVLDGGSGSAIVLKDSKGVSVTNLSLQGMGRRSGNVHGVGVLVDHCAHVTIDGVEAAGFQFAGIAVEGSEHVSITHVYARDNGFAGITTRGDVNKDVYIGHSRAINNPGDPSITDNHSGNGICLYSVQGALVEYSEAAENGWDMQQENWNGPVGIWTAAGADSVVIQYCISHHNKSPKGDGGGFDFDGGTTNCLMQYNYSYQNGGCGYLLCQYPGGALWKNNTIRYCISENDGLTDHRAGIFTYMGEILYDCFVYNNVIYNEAARHCIHGAPIGSHWHNNVFLLGGEGEFLHQVEQDTGSWFHGNCYWRLNGDLGMNAYSSIDEWRQATGFELLGERKTGLQMDPQICLPPADAVRPTDPRELRTMQWFRLSDDSPLARVGLDLKTLFAIDPGNTDFFGMPLPSTEFSLGICEVSDGL